MNTKRLTLHDDAHYRTLPIDPLVLIESMAADQHWPYEVVYHCGESLLALLRFQHKNGTRDLRKAAGLLERAADILDGHPDFAGAGTEPEPGRPIVVDDLGTWHDISEMGRGKGLPE